MAEASRKADQAGSGVEEWAGTAQDASKGAAQKATKGAAYVQDKLGAVDDTVRDYTLRPLLLVPRRRISRWENFCPLGASRNLVARPTSLLAYLVAPVSY